MRPGEGAPVSERREQEIRVPARGPVIAVLLAGLVAGGAAAAALAILAENPPGRGLATGLGVSGTVAVTAGSGFLFYGARPRPAGDVQTRWMAATLARFVAIPLLCVSIYFYLPAGGQFAVLAAAGTYLACLAAETATVAWSVNRSLDQPPP